MSRARRNPAPGFTAPVALAAIMGDQPLAERAEACEGHPNQIRGETASAGVSGRGVRRPHARQEDGGAGPQGAD